jgi:hypothetical protein
VDNLEVMESSLMQIIINRSSVCAGDDIQDHSKIYDLSDDVTYEDIFNRIIQDRYLPNISGNNVVWVLMTKDENTCIFSYFTQTNYFSAGLAEKKIKKICKDDNKLFFKYFSSPLKWKEYIYAMYKGESYALWRDGWLDECEYCDYIMELGTE